MTVVAHCRRCMRFIASLKTLSFKWQMIQVKTVSDGGRSLTKVFVVYCIILWKTLSFKWQILQWKNSQCSCYQSMTDVFEILATVNDWCVWGSCYGQWRKSVTDVLLEVKLTSVLPLCPAPTMRLALVLHPLKRCTKCSVNDESGRSLTKACPPGAWSKRDRVPALF